VEELLDQWKLLPGTPTLDHVVFACGSGGTAAGIALGIALAYRACSGESPAQMPTVHAIGVCDDPDYFYQFVAKIADQMGFQNPTGEEPNGTTTEDFVRQHLVAHQGKGLGYALSTDAELEFVMSFARDTGIVLDPVYSGKALYNFFQFVQEHPDSFSGKNILFWHTGGVLGLYDKCADLLPTLKKVAPCHRLDVYGKGIGIDVSSPTNFESPS
jgi:1-aminocyclopropane-1-carboxylate deaminase/D-cysteine desulfhydrase-like pyridoxal-dependent ACC family enzyme